MNPDQCRFDPLSDRGLASSVFRLGLLPRSIRETRADLCTIRAAIEMVRQARYRAAWSRKSLAWVRSEAKSRHANVVTIHWRGYVELDRQGRACQRRRNCPPRPVLGAARLPHAGRTLEAGPT